MRLDFITTIILLVLLVYVLYTPTNQEVEKRAESVSAFARDYDYFMTDLQNMVINGDQEPRYRLRADKYTHYPEPEHSLLEAPDMLIYRDAEPRWHITSQRGRMEPEPSVTGESARGSSVPDNSVPGRKVELGGNVVARWHEPQKEELNIYTEYLAIYPDAERFSTDKQVTIVINGSRLVATGMKGDLNTDRVKLLADVKGHYDKKESE